MWIFLLYLLSPTEAMQTTLHTYEYIIILHFSLSNATSYYSILVFYSYNMLKSFIALSIYRFFLWISNSEIFSCYFAWFEHIISVILGTLFYLILYIIVALFCATNAKKMSWGFKKFKNVKPIYVNESYTIHYYLFYKKILGRCPNRLYSICKFSKVRQNNFLK